MMDRDYCIAELPEAERMLYQAQCRVRCLEANLDRIDPEDFEPLMESLETVRPGTSGRRTQGNPRTGCPLRVRKEAAQCGQYRVAVKNLCSPDGRTLYAATILP